MDDTNSIAALRKVEKTADSSRIYKITRNALTQEEFDDAFSQSNGNDQTTLTQQIKAKVKKSLSQKWFTRNLLEEWIPIVRWMREYDIKTSLVSDISAGITVGTMNIPQSMAYAELAMLDPVIGLYTSMAALIYAFFGTSKHVSLGTFAVVSLLVADAQTNYYDSHPNSTLSHGELVSSLTFTVGLILLIFACLQLHVLMAYLSDALISGFTVGCVCHVFISVLPKMFGVSIISPGGLLTLFKSTIDFFEKLPDTNFADLIISVIAVVFLYVGKEMINPWLRRTNKLPVPIPFELILVFFNTLFSYLFNFRQFGVSVVGIIPTGFPTPRMIRFETIPDLLVAGDAISIAVVIYVITFSVAKLFAKKHNYKVNAKQDLRALVICELIVSFFGCLPCSGSLSRSTINSNMGARSQVSALVSATMIFVVIMFAAPLLECLPLAILSSIVLVALIGIFRQVYEVPGLYKTSSVDFIIWMTSCTFVVIWDVSQALLLAVIFELLTVIVRTQYPKFSLLVQVGETDMYKDLNRYKYEESPYIIVYRFDAPLLFLNCENFTHSALSHIRKSKMNFNPDLERTDKSSEKFKKYLIVDASGITAIDSMGVKCIDELAEELKKHDVRLLISNCKGNVRQMCESCGLYKKVSKCDFFPSNHDAMLNARFYYSLAQSKDEATLNE